MDVSKYQTALNYTAAKIAGITFAMVKATQGHEMNGNAYLFADSLFTRHVEGFHKVGIPVGAYHFFTARTLEETYKEADFFIETVLPYKDKISLYLACDAENYNNKYLTGLSKAQLSSLVNAFCTRVEGAGFRACHYTNTDHISRFIDISKIAYPVWQAHYIKDGFVKRPTDAGANLAIHQYTNTGALPGVIGKYDLNFGYAPLARLIISKMTSIMDVTLDFMEKSPTGDQILMKLAESIVKKDLNPIRTPTHEKLVSNVRSHSGLTPEEAVYLNNYKWNRDLFYKLYSAMLHG